MAEIIYFEKNGIENTEETLQLALKRYQQGGVRHIIIASNYGDTAFKAIEIFKDTDAKFIVISIDKHWDGKLRLSAEKKKKIEELGHFVYKGLMVFEYHRLTKDQGAKLMAETLRLFSEGMKVAVEMVLMTVSGELIEAGEKVIAIAGTHRGADTAVVITAASIFQFAKFKVNEILCKPLN